MSAVIFIILTLLVIYGIYAATQSRYVTAVYLILMLTTGLLSLSGLLQLFPPLLIACIVVSATVTILLYKKHIKGQPVNEYYLLAIHSLRLPLELVLYRLYIAGKIPVLMTFEGWNYDIIMGISALFLLLYQSLRGSTGRLTVIVWNACGILLLTIVVAIAIFSSPLPIQQLAFEQPNIAVLEFPFCMLPVIVVPVVYLAHSIQLGQAIQKRG